MNTKGCILTSGKATRENATFGVHALKKSNSLFLLYFKIAIIQFVQMRQPSGQTQYFLSSHFVSNLMHLVCLLGMITGA